MPSPGNITYGVRLYRKWGALRGGVGNRPGKGGKVSLRALYGLVSGRVRMSAPVKSGKSGWGGTPDRLWAGGYGAS